MLHQLTAAWKNLRWANAQNVSLHVKIFLNQRHVVIDKWWKVLLTLLTQLIVFSSENEWLNRLFFDQLVLINTVCHWYFIHSFNRSTMCKVSLVNLKNCMKKLEKKSKLFSNSNLFLEICAPKEHSSHSPQTETGS